MRPKGESASHHIGYPPGPPLSSPSKTNKPTLHRKKSFSNQGHVVLANVWQHLKNQLQLCLIGNYAPAYAWITIRRGISEQHEWARLK